MQVTVNVPGPLREYGDCESRLVLDARTVREALLELERIRPGLHRGICDETGAVRRHVNLFVNRSHVRDLAGLETVLSPGDEITIIPAVSGG
jgi:sulfur-carrier protein